MLLIFNLFYCDIVNISTNYSILVFLWRLTQCKHVLKLKLYSEIKSVFYHTESTYNSLIKFSKRKRCFTSVQTRSIYSKSILLKEYQNFVICVSHTYVVMWLNFESDNKLSISWFFFYYLSFITFWHYNIQLRFKKIRTRYLSNHLIKIFFKYLTEYEILERNLLIHLRNYS